MQFPDKQKEAIDCLRQISEDPFTLDQKIHRIDRLYRSLEVTQKTKPKPQPKKTIQHKQNATFFEQPNQKTFRSCQMSSMTTYEHWHNPIRPKSQFAKQEERYSRKRDPNAQKGTHHMFAQLKSNLMKSLAIDGLPIIGHSNKFKNMMGKTVHESRTHRGRIWHGRPPVKIIHYIQ